MADTDATVPRRRRSFRPLKVVAAILVFLLALLVSYGLWTVYENTLTTAALDQGLATNTKPAQGELSPTATRALKAYGGEAVWRNATAVESTVTVGGLLFQLKGAGIPLMQRSPLIFDILTPSSIP